MVIATSSQKTAISTSDSVVSMQRAQIWFFFLFNVPCHIWPLSQLPLACDHTWLRSPALDRQALPHRSHIWSVFTVGNVYVPSVMIRLCRGRFRMGCLSWLTSNPYSYHRSAFPRESIPAPNSVNWSSSLKRTSARVTMSAPYREFFDTIPVRCLGFQDPSRLRCVWTFQVAI